MPLADDFQGGRAGHELDLQARRNYATLGG
jgi:hypothetical protein